MRIYKLPIILAFTSLTGCFSPQAVQSNIHNESDLQLAQDYYGAKPMTCVGNYYCDDVRSELQSRDVIPADEWTYVNSNTVVIGMGALAVVAAWGQPTDVNTTTTSAGEEDQWVYSPCETCKSSYVYLKNGVVTAIQN